MPCCSCEDGPRDAVDENKITIFGACCCCNSGFLGCDECLGCSGESKMCCCEGGWCLKPGAPWLCCGCCGCKFSECTCCQQQSQCCCLVSSAAFPPTSEVPCMMAYCGLMCYPKCGCCVKQGDAVASAKARTPSGAPPKPEEIER